LKFNLWLERREVREAILGVLGVSLGEESGVLDKNTTYFSPEIRDKIKNLGVVKSTNDDMGRYGEIVRAIDDGIQIGELIKMVEDSI
jgi:hypothetical protein